jgi:hypothetical protein
MKPNQKSVFMGTTAVPARASRDQIMALLIDRGAQNISQEYGLKKVVGLSFGLVTKFGPMRFDLPLRVDPIFAKLQEERRRQREQHAAHDMESAERIAWRQLLRWVEVQLAMVDLGMAQDAEVFMPYAVQQGGKTMFAMFTEQRLLGAGAPAK